MKTALELLGNVPPRQVFDGALTPSSVATWLETVAERARAEAFEVAARLVTRTIAGNSDFYALSQLANDIRALPTTPVAKRSRIYCECNTATVTVDGAAICGACAYRMDGTRSRMGSRRPTRRAVGGERT